MNNIAHYYGITITENPVFDGDGLVAFLSNKSGTSQIHIHDLKTGEERQLTHLPERVLNIYRTNTPGVLYFSSDKKGDEQTQIYKIAITTGDVTALTDNPNAKFTFGGLLKSGKEIILSSNARNTAHYDICRLDTETNEITILVENSDNYNIPSAVSPNERYVLYNKMRSSKNNPLWMLDLETGQARPLFAEGAVYVSPRFAQDSAGFYLITEDGSDNRYVAYYDIASGVLHKVYEDKWDVESITLSHDDRILGLCINEGGYSSIVALNLQDGRPENIITPPKSHIHSVVFAQDSYEMLFCCSSVRRPSGVWWLDMDNDKMERLTDSRFGELRTEDLVEPELRSYKSFDGLTVPYWLYQKSKASKPGPVVISIHGGPEAQAFPVFNPLIAYLVNEGFTVVAPNVRGSSGYGKHYASLDDVEKRLDSVHDIIALKEHLEQEGIAAQGATGVMGGSYGGYMTVACLAFYPGLFGAGVDTVGLVNFETFMQNTSLYRRPHREAEYGSLSAHRHILREVSPIHRVGDIVTPLMVIHGKNDPRVPVSEAEQLVAALRSRDVDVEYLCYEDEGHGISKQQNKLDCYPRVVAFLKKHLIVE